MSIIGKQLPEFTLDAFKKPELVKVSTADVLGKWSIFVFYPADFTFVCPTEHGLMLLQALIKSSTTC